MKTKTEQALELMAKAAELLKEEAEAGLNPRVEEWPQVGDEVWILTSSGIENRIYKRSFYDADCINSGSMFRTKEEVLLANKARIAVTKIKNYAREKWGEFKPDWEDGSQYKYVICYNHEAELYYPTSSRYGTEFPPTGHFRKEKHAEEIIEKFPEELYIIRRFYT